MSHGFPGETCTTFFHTRQRWQNGKWNAPAGRESGGWTERLKDVGVVVGTRRAGLAAFESKSPVTVVSGERLREQGSTDMLDVLRDSVPSFNVNMQPIADGATVVRPPNLRNLAADHTLVMVNGKRRHRGGVDRIGLPRRRDAEAGADPNTGSRECPGRDAGAQSQCPFRTRQPVQPVRPGGVQRAVRVSETGPGILTPSHFRIAGSRMFRQAESARCWSCWATRSWPRR